MTLVQVCDFVILVHPYRRRLQAGKYWKIRKNIKEVIFFFVSVCVLQFSCKLETCHTYSRHSLLVSIYYSPGAAGKRNEFVETPIHHVIYISET